MLEFLTLIVEHPYADVVTLLALIAAIGFLIFFWGFTGYFLAHGDSDHQAHARVQMVQGVTLFFAILVLWEVLRSLGGLLT